MVCVKVIQAFEHHAVGDDIELEPLDAALKSRAGLVSLLHGTLYQTREMVASHATLSVDSFLHTSSTIEPAKRRRGRPRKVRV